jgi:hypothetical protein
VKGRNKCENGKGLEERIKEEKVNTKKAKKKSTKIRERKGEREK